MASTITVRDLVNGGGVQKVTVSQAGIQGTQGPAGTANATVYTKTGLPAGTHGDLAVISDDVRGLWHRASDQWLKTYPFANAKDFGAVGDDTANETTALTNWGASGAAGLILPPGTYLTDPGTSLGDAKTVLAHRAIIKRRVNGTDALLSLGADAAVEGLELDGGNATLADSTKDERGLFFTGSRPHARNISSHNHDGQGFRVSDVPGTAPGGLLEDLQLKDNGHTPGVNGTADGLYVQNQNGLAIKGVIATNSARTNIVATTSVPDPADSVGVRLEDFYTSGGGYNEINFEQVSDGVIADGIAEGLVTFANSPRMTIRNVTCQKMRGADADNPTIEDVLLNGSGAEILYLTGDSPICRNVRVEPTAPTGSTVVISPPDGRCNIQIEALTGDNTFVLGAPSVIGAGSFAKLNALGGTVLYKIVRAGGQSRPDGAALEIEDGKLRWRSAAAPTSNYYEIGDIVWNTSPGTVGWICIASGTPGTWASFGAVALDGSVVWNPPSIADGGSATQTVTVTGAVFNDYSLVTAPYDVQNLNIQADVTAADTVTIRIQNNTGGPIDLGSGTWRVRCLKQ